MDQTNGAQRNPFLSESNSGQTATRTIPIIQPPSIQTSAPSPGDPMEMSPPGTATMGPPSRTGDDGTNGIHDQMGLGDQQPMANLAGSNASAAGAASAQVPKVVQTAFIHKLYK